MNRIPQTQLESYAKCQDEKPASKLQMIREAFDHFGGRATTFEIAEHLKWSVHCVSGKITVLQDKGEVADSGETKEHKTRGATRNVAVWMTGKFPVRDKMTKKEMITLIVKLQAENKRLKAELNRGNI